MYDWNKLNQIQSKRTAERDNAKQQHTYAGFDFVKLIIAIRQLNFNTTKTMQAN